MDKLFEMNENNSVVIKYNGNEREVVIPASVREIGERAFEDNEFIESITFEGEKIVIGGWAFKACKKLARVNVKGGFSRLEQFAFAGCEALEEIDLSGASEVGELAFGCCSGLKCVKITDSMKFIGDMAFGFCESLESIYFPDSVDFIDGSALMECQKLTSVRLPENLTEIPCWMFFNCNSLTEIKIPETVKIIGKLAFGMCSSLAEIDLPESVEAIEKCAFAGCTSLSDITIRGDIKKCGANLFDEIRELNFHLTPKSRCEHLAADNTSLERVTITGEGAQISECMFHHCEGLENVTIADGITKIGGGAFDCCYQLAEISIPDSVKSIGKMAFAFCIELCEIALPSGLKNVADSAFMRCSELKRVVLPNTVEVIEESAFYCCEKLREIYVPDSVKIVEKDAFARCPLLVSLPEKFVSENNSDEDEYFGFEDILFDKGTYYEPIGSHKIKEEDIMGKFKISVLGVGCVGSESVGLMAKSFRSDEYVSVEFMVADNTSAIRKYSADNVSIRLLRSSSQLSDSELESIREFFDEANIAYICIGLGETAGIIAPEISKIAKESGAFTICAYTNPLEYEPSEKHKSAEEQLESIKGTADALVEIKTKIERGMSIKQVYETIDEQFRSLVQMTPNLYNGDCYIGADIDRFLIALRGARSARFITETVQGENRFQELVEKLSAIIPQNTKRAVAHFSCFNEITFEEFSNLLEELNKSLDENAMVVTSMSLFSEIPEGKISLSIIAAE